LVENVLAAQGIARGSGAPKSMPPPAPTAKELASPSSIAAEIADRFFGSPAKPEAKIADTSSAASFGTTKTADAPIPSAPTTDLGKRPEPPAKAAIEIQVFVSENDVRRAMTRSEKIFIGRKTILTPSARDLGLEHEVFVETEAGSIRWGFCSTGFKPVGFVFLQVHLQIPPTWTSAWIAPTGYRRQKNELEWLTPMDAQTLRESLTDAIRYWEPMRLAYNAVLAVIVLIYFWRGYPASKADISVDGILILFLLAVLANVAYCAVYLVDIFAQSSGYRETWRKNRWVLFAIGLLFAGTITRFWAAAMFSSSSK
jgi:hypothetical protein